MSLQEKVTGRWFLPPFIKQSVVAQPSQKRGLELERISGIQMGGVTMTPKDLSLDRESWKNESFGGNENCYASQIQKSDVFLAHQLLSHYAPFRLVGDISEPILKAVVKREPQEVEREDLNSQKYFMRLYPVGGNIARVLWLSNRHNPDIAIEEESLARFKVSMVDRVGLEVILREMDGSDCFDRPALKAQGIKIR